MGAFCPEPLISGIAASEVRRADAVCLDATFGDPRLIFPPRKEAIAAVRAFAQTALGDGQTPVLLASLFGALPAVARDLAQAGMTLRAHPRVAAVLSRLSGVCESLPTPARFAGRVAKGEVLLWPPEAREASNLAGLDNLRFALVSGSAAEPGVLERLRVQHGFALTNFPSAAEIVTAIDATGAKEVALFHGGAEPLAALLRERGLDAYALGPPRQMTLPGGA
jgi:putative mRNA 3-end processing factor